MFPRFAYIFFIALLGSAGAQAGDVSIETPPPAFKAAVGSEHPILILGDPDPYTAVYQGVIGQVDSVGPMALRRFIVDTGVSGEIILDTHVLSPSYASADLGNGVVISFTGAYYGNVLPGQTTELAYAMGDETFHGSCTGGELNARGAFVATCQESNADGKFHSVTVAISSTGLMGIIHHGRLFGGRLMPHGFLVAFEENGIDLVRYGVDLASLGETKQDG